MAIQNLYIFNPDHDLALAHGGANFTAPAAARRLAEDFAALPAWYAEEGSLVLAPPGCNNAYLKQWREVFPSLPLSIAPAEVSGRDLRVMPWGWNPVLRKSLARMGIDSRLLPTDEALDTIRRYAHRRFPSVLLPHLRLEGTCGESFLFENPGDIKHFVENREKCVLKAPLSGSGKGLTWCKGVYTYGIGNWCNRVLEQQGAVVGEPAYDKQMDFSMQFHCGAEVKFLGYSLFRTSPAGAYTGSTLTGDDDVKRRLNGYLPPELPARAQAKLEQLLTGELSGKYEGHLSVDMMVCRFPDYPHYRLHPCVEINLRMTMGMLSHKLYEKYISPASRGEFRMEYYPSPKHLADAHSVLSGLHPVTMSDGRVSEGYLPLVPVTPHSRYMAWVLVEPYG